LSHESFPQLQVIFDEYAKISGKTIEQAVKAELSGDVGDAIMTIGTNIVNLVIKFTLNSFVYS
jgi:hypothetical protein